MSQFWRPYFSALIESIFTLGKTTHLKLRFISKLFPSMKLPDRVNLSELRPNQYLIHRIPLNHRDN